MTQDFLSQEDVDALLRGVTDERDDPPEDEVDRSIPRIYDLGRQERIVRGRMPTLELINDRFARYFRIGLFNFMHRSTEISVGPVRMQKYRNFIRNLVVPTNLNLVQIKPFHGTGLIVFDPNLIFLVIDNLFGGDGRFHTRVEGRDFTLMEQRVILGLLDVFFEEYQKAWKTVYPVRFEYLRSEMNTQFANVATPQEVVLAFTFTIEMSGNSAEMHCCLPYLMVEPIKDLLYSSIHSEQPDGPKLSGKSLPVLLQSWGSLGQVNLEDIANWRAGDTLLFEDKFTLTANGIGISALRGPQNMESAHRKTRRRAAGVLTEQKTI